MSIVKEESHMSNRFLFFITAFLIIIPVFFKFNGFVKAQSQDLSIYLIPPRPPLYAGNSFILEVRIVNQNATMSHVYKLEWEVDGYWWFTSQGIIDPNETISVTPSFTFSTAGDHTIFVEIYEDEAKMDQRYRYSKIIQNWIIYPVLISLSANGRRIRRGRRCRWSHR